MLLHILGNLRRLSPFEIQQILLIITIEILSNFFLIYSVVIMCHFLVVNDHGSPHHPISCSSEQCLLCYLHKLIK